MISNMYQRQKKRNAEFRKKHHKGRARDRQKEDHEGRARDRQKEDHEGRARDRQKEVAKKGGGERQPGKVDRTQEPKAQETEPLATPSRDVPSNEEGRVAGDQGSTVRGSVAGDQGTQHSTSQRMFSKRKVVSNWDRYHEGEEGEGSVFPEESEEELQQRLVQLLNLPTKPHPLATPTDVYSSVAKDSSNLEKHSCLSLDCAALADSLSSLPLHQRLDISLQLLELGNDDSETGAGSQETPSGEPHTSVESSVLDLSRLPRAQPGAESTAPLDFQFPSPRSKGPEQVTLKGKGATSNQKATEKATPINVSSLGSGGSQGQEQHDPESNAVAKGSEGDGVLDQLLAEVPARQPMATGSTGSGNAVGEQSNPPSETAELDSMLDELLA